MGLLEWALSAAAFVNSVLMFWVEPMLAKRLLPVLGGSPAVWNVCVVFFQAALLAGYALARAGGMRLGRAASAALLIAPAVAAAALGPPAVAPAAGAPPPAQPIAWLLGTLTAGIGLPFLVLSATGPMLAFWLARTARPAGRDPYFLYSASSLGSVAGLLLYPIVLEPTVTLADQSLAWMVCFRVQAALLLVCAALSLREEAAGTGSVGTDAPPRWGLRWVWVALAFLPSSLMLGVTTFITTDLAPIPLLWVTPLALYLLTQFLAFSHRSLAPDWLASVVRQPLFEHTLSSWLLPLAALPAAVVLVRQAAYSIFGLAGLHLTIFFAAALMCHRRLVALRPSAEHLGDFYFWMGLGGVLGGIFNALAAPFLFSKTLEYPLALVLVACTRQLDDPEDPATGADVAVPIAIGAGAWLLALVPGSSLWPAVWHPLWLLVPPGLATVACWRRPLRFGLAMATMVLVSDVYPDRSGSVRLVRRTFFGVHSVVDDRAHGLRWLRHGVTVHGAQWLDPARAREPLTYYTRSGPLGAIFDAFRSVPSHGAGRVAVVGLGTGSMVAYARPGDRWTFYEIDPEIVRIARDSGLFTFLVGDHPVSGVASGAAGTGAPRIVVGDARLTLAGSDPGALDLLVLDAFSSDAIPLHLLTREALALYVSRLAPGGLIALHISNRYLDLAPPIGDLARDAGLLALEKGERIAEQETQETGKESSRWMVLARREEDAGLLGTSPGWRRVDGRPSPRVWTDDFSNVLACLDTTTD